VLLVGGQYHILIYGCQMNERDAETIAGLLGGMDYTKTEDIDKADIIIVHTCCVRESAENKIFGKIGELKHLKKTKPNLIIGICGCMVQQKEVAEKLLNRAPHVDLIFGTHNLHQLPQLIRQNLLTGTRIFEVWDEEGQIVENLPAQREGGLKAFVTITYGCNNYCTYCIVPYVRGRERSRIPEEIIKEITQLGEEGFREVTLLGQNVNSYGKDFIDVKMDFSDLLAKIDTIPEVWRIRYMTSHPRDFNAKLVLAVKNSQHICPHFHLPIQSGSDRILAAMNRGYTKEQYLDLVSLIKEELPEASVTTDIIVGFPGETEEDFEHTLDVVKKAKFDASYTFLYSQRSGTPAATMAAQISEEVKKERLQRLISVQNEISLEINQQLADQEVIVLAEGPSKTNPDVLTGRTATNKIVIFSGEESLIGQLVPVRIIATKTWNLVGGV
jgi:tRNA-2-methylthio-N6-dimethylallyladenosine synthase